MYISLSSYKFPRFSGQALGKAIDTFIITPNTDTPYFYLWVDLPMQSPLL